MVSGIFAPVIKQPETTMHASTHSLDFNPAADCSFVHVRETRTSCVGAPTPVTHVEPGLDPQRAANEGSCPRLRSNGIHFRLAAQLEHALFAVTLAASGFLYLGALLANPV